MNHESFAYVRLELRKTYQVATLGPALIASLENQLQPKLHSAVAASELMKIQETARRSDQDKSPGKRVRIVS